MKFNGVVLTKILFEHWKAASAAFPFDIGLSTEILLGPGKAASAIFPFDIVSLTKILGPLLANYQTGSNILLTLKLAASILAMPTIVGDTVHQCILH